MASTVYRFTAAGYPTLSAASLPEAEDLPAPHSRADSHCQTSVAGRETLARFVVMARYRRRQLRPGQRYAPHARRAWFG